MELNEALLLVNKHVRDLTTYHLEPHAARIKINQNENPSDWPYDIKDEIARFCRERPWNRYPGFVPEDLKRKLAQYIGHVPEGIIVGNGSNEMLLTSMISFVNSSAGAIICQPTFTLYKLLARGLGGAVDEVPLASDLSFDVNGIIEAVTRRPGAFLILCSPNNPTGSVLQEDDIRRILAAHRGIFLLDQAYVEFGGFNAFPLLRGHPNLIITRTFSKAMAGAGLRLGYLLGAPRIVFEMNKVKLPYNINFFVEKAAEVLLSHTDYVGQRVEEIIAERESLYSFFKRLPFDAVYPTGANFLLVRCNRKAELFTHLLSNGILVRDVSGYPMCENCLRINAGSKEENEELKRALTSFFKNRTDAPASRNSPSSR